MHRPTRTRLLFAAKLGFSALLLAIVVAKLDFHGIVERVKGANWRWLVPNLFLGQIVVALAAQRWKVLSQGLLRFWPAFRYTWIGVFFGSIVPGAVSGDLAKGLSLAAKNKGVRDERLPVSILFDKIIGLWALLALFCLVAPVIFTTHPQAMEGARGLIICGFGGMIAGIAAGAAAMHRGGLRQIRRLVFILPHPKIRSWAERALDAIGRYATQPRLVYMALAISVAIHGINALAFWMVLRALAVPASLFFAAAVYPLLSLLLALPISISGIGVRDIFLFSVFRAFGLNPEAGLAFSWLLLGLNLPVIVIGGLIQVWEVFKPERDPSRVVPPAS